MISNIINKTACTQALSQQLFRSFSSASIGLSMPTLNTRTSQNKPKEIVVFFGAPGVGKGTFARLMAKDYDYIKISPGDEIRKILKGKAESNLHESIIRKVQAAVAEGKLVDDGLVTKILNARLRDPSNRDAKGFILDGFPRTKNQLDWITKEFPESMFVNMFLKEEVLIEGLLGRRTCIDCGHTYNVKSYNKDGYQIDAMVPEFEGVCDHCGGDVVLREDDNLPAIMNRIKVYEKETMPLLKKCVTKPSFMEFEAKRGIYDYDQFISIFEKELKKNRPRKHYFMSSAALGENLILSL